MRGGQPSQPLVMPADGPDARIYETAIRRAIELVHADGGSIAIRDDARQAMVLRVRRIYTGMQLQPLPAPGYEQIDEAATTVLPAAQLWRLYRRGERLIGHVWQTGEPVIMTDTEVHGLPGGNAPADPNAAYHLAIPIFAPITNDATPTEDPPVIGVVAVHVNDPRWRFTQQHLILLQSHAQNIAQSLMLAQVERREQQHRRLLFLLRELTGELPVMPDNQTFYKEFFDRIYNGLRGVVDTEAFAIVLPQRRVAQSRPLETTLVFYAIHEVDQTYPEMRLHEKQVPWWSYVAKGRSVGWTTDAEREANRDLATRQWGSATYMDSQLYIPLKSSSDVIGALAVASSRRYAYNAEHIGLLEMAGRFIGLAIENAQIRTAHRINSHASESDRALAILNNSFLGLNSSLDLNVIIRDLVEQSSELARGQVCAYLEYDQITDEFIIRDAAQSRDHQAYAPVIGQRIPIGNGRRRHALGEPHTILEELNDEHERGDIVGTLLARFSIDAVLLMPVSYAEGLSQRQRIFGLLVLFSPGQSALFSPSELINLRALVQVGAAAMNNAQTYEQLREVDRLKDEFILTASHEFRTPMSAIQGFSWLIQKRGATMTPEQGKYWASEIIRATEQLKDMMDAITEAWRTKSVQIPPLQPVNMTHVVQLAMEMATGPLSAQNHTIDISIREPYWVMGDQDRIRHIIVNLVTNASKYSAPGSRITLAANVKSAADLLAAPRERGARNANDEEPVNNVVPGSGPWVVISIHDRGSGISAANMKRLFAKFVRLELTTNVRGTGLGLYICRRYVEAMGGEIWVESAPGQGSTFHFCLPQTQEPPTQLASDAV